MNKLLLFSISASVTAVAAFGQSHSLRLENRFKSFKAAKNTIGTSQRCIASVFTLNAGSIHFVDDSETYIYSGSQGGCYSGGDLMETSLKYDHSVKYYNTGISFDSGANAIQTFDSHSNIFTNVKQQFDGFYGTFMNSSKTMYTYDSSGNQVIETDQSWNTATSAWDNTVKYIHTYTTGNLLHTRTAQVWSGSDWRNYFLETFSYNSTNKPTTVIHKRWDNTTLTWEPNLRITATYDSTGNLTSALSEVWYGTFWVSDGKELYSNYTASGLYQQFIVQHYDIDSMAFFNDYKDSIVYNTYDHPVYYFKIPWSFDLNSWNTDTTEEYHFYYEPYTTTAITDVKAEATTMDVYPNPASHVVNINAVIAEGKNSTISLLDASGRIVSTIDGNNIHEGVNNIQYPLEQLPAGIYFVSLKNDKANITRKIVIAK